MPSDSISNESKTQHDICAHDSLERDSFDDNRCLGVPDLESDRVHRLQPVRHVVEDEVAVLQQLVMLIT